MKTVRLNSKFIKHRMVDMDIKTVTQLSKLLGVSRQWTHVMLDNSKNGVLTPRKLAKLIELLQCDFNDLLMIVEVEGDE